MRKMIMVLMVLIVSMTTTLFAGTFVAFTSEEAFNNYCDSDHTEFDTSAKEIFEEGTSDFTNQLKKKATFIVVVDDEVNIIYCILLYAYDSKSFGVIIFDDHFDRIVDTGIFIYKKYDPVMVGLSCLKERVTHILDLDKMEVTFCESKYVRNPYQK